MQDRGEKLPFVEMQPGVDKIIFLERVPQLMGNPMVDKEYAAWNGRLRFSIQDIGVLALDDQHDFPLAVALNAHVGRGLQAAGG